MLEEVLEATNQHWHQVGIRDTLSGGSHGVSSGRLRGQHGVEERDTPDLKKFIGVLYGPRPRKQLSHVKQGKDH